jgi:hypothetical protein
MFMDGSWNRVDSVFIHEPCTAGNGACRGRGKDKGSLWQVWELNGDFL